MIDKFFMGIDIGACSTAVVVLEEQKKIVVQKIFNTYPNHKISAQNASGMACEELSRIYKRDISQKQISFCTGTGYGRENIVFANTSITEVAAHTKGVRFYYPQARTILDIGGQNSKVIRLNEKGEVVDFVMNEKCAAGAGRFLEKIAEIMEVPMEQLGILALGAKSEAKISSMCTVFAESEVISKIASEISKESIIKGVHSGILSRLLSLCKRLGIETPVVLSGGVAKNIAIVQMFLAQSGIEKNSFFVPPDPQIIGALGAAFNGWEECQNFSDKEGKKSSVWDIWKPKEMKHTTHQDKPVIGWTDLSVPVEIITAAGLYNTRIRGDMDLTGNSSEQYVRTYSCDYIKNVISSLLDSPKHKDLSGIITTNCCIATEKMFDVLRFQQQEKRFLYALSIPRKDDDLAVEYMKKNILHLKATLEENFHLEITHNALKESCLRYNKIKKLLKKYNLLLLEKNFPNAAYLAGWQMERLWTIMDITDGFLNEIEEEISTIQALAPLHKKGPNILLMGSMVPDMEFYRIFEDIPCQIVYNNTSSGSKFCESMVDLEEDDIYRSLAKRCLYFGYNPRMMSVDKRVAYLKETMDLYKIDAVVFLISKFCVCYSFESVLLQKYMEEWKIPFLVMETEFSTKDYTSFKMRIEALVTQSYKHIDG